MKTPRHSACNVLANSPAGRSLWQFAAGSHEVTLQKEQITTTAEPFPTALVRKSWRSLGRSKLNIAWLPLDQVFLRVVHLPPADPKELPAMLELQLEKLSPLPVNQIIWTFENLTQPGDAEQTLVCVIAERSQVEQFLGALERDGFLADRLEVPLLHVLRQQRPTQDGAWVYVVNEGKWDMALVAWWTNGGLRNISLLRMPVTERGPQTLRAHLTRLAWAGEIEGWLTGPPQVHLVVDEERRAVWESALRESVGEALDSHPALPPRQLAVWSASRAARNRSVANLLPGDFALRYRQQAVDRVWMTGLAAVVVVYLLAVAVNFGAIRWKRWELSRLKREATVLSAAYTNAITLKERLQVFQEQAALKYAALECLRISSELLPTELTLDSFHFQSGKSLRLAGTVAKDSQIKVTEYNGELRKTSIKGKPLFDRTKEATPRFTDRGAGPVQWDFTADLNVVWQE